MKAVILNSGLGKRMGALTENTHKSMVTLANGETVFGRQLRLLYSCGIREFLITTGPYEEALKAQAAISLPDDCSVAYVSNKQYNQTNYIYSLYLAKEELQGDLLLLHGDLVFDRHFVEQLLFSQDKNLVAVDKSKPLPEKDFKAQIEDGFIKKIAIDIFGADCFALQPFYKLDAHFVKQWMDGIAQFIHNGQTGCYAENALNELLAKLKLRPFSYETHCVEEIDTPQDHQRVSEQIRSYDFAHQHLIDAPGAVGHIPALLKQYGIKRPLLVCDAAYQHLPVQIVLDKAGTGINVTPFADFTPNPRYEEVVKGVEAYRQAQCDGILSVGGGSAIDVAKCIKCYSVLNDSQHYMDQQLMFSPIVHIAVPTTAGTGSEGTRFAVIYRDGEKQSVAHDCIFPDAAILDSRLLKTLPDYQRKAGYLDALCHGLESMWSVNATDQSRQLAKHALKALVENGAAYFAKDEGSACTIMSAAHEVGLAINLTQTTAAHAMSYKLTSLYNIAHGHAAALCLKAVWKKMIEQNNIDLHTEEAKHLALVFEQIAEAVSESDVHAAYDKIVALIDGLALPQLPVPTAEQIDALTNSVNLQRLKNNPIAFDAAQIRSLYLWMLEPIR